MTTFGKNQGSQRPTAMGSLLQASTYGSTIPTIYGQTQGTLLAIWAAHLRQGGSTKKFKQMKKGITAYVENIDFLVGHNPVMGILQMYVNGTPYPLTYTSQSFTLTGPGSFDVTDPHFYFVVAVTLTQSYSMTVNDYGGGGSQTLSGTYEVPLWNELELGPDPTNGSAVRNAPFCYRWQPSYGSNVYVDSKAIPSGTLKVYYAQLMAATSYQPPITKLRMAFESELGSGDEYADAPAPFNAQQIIYPHFAGIGSSEVDLGSSGALPQLNAEIRGKWGIYSAGDGDFADMIEDVFKSGIAQAAIGSGTAFTQMERGLSSYDLPGCVQIKVQSGSSSLSSVLYNLPNTAGNFLVVAASGAAASTLSISDSASNTWTPVFGSGLGYQVWRAQAVAAATNTVMVTGLSGAAQITLLEVAGCDTFDSAVIGSSGAASLTTTGSQGFPGFVLAVSLFLSAANPSDPGLVQWPAIVANPNFYGNVSPRHLVQGRIVNSAAACAYPAASSVPNGLCLLAFKCVNPASYPKPLGDFIDSASLDIVRAQCRANGLWGALYMNTQSAASDWLKTLYAAADAAPVYLGSKLFSFPYSEVSAAGNGAMYTAPTASGPIANLDAANGDFTVPPKLVTGSRIQLPNVLQMQCISREANYNPVTVAQPDAASIALYGVRKEDPVVNNAVQSASVARQLLGIKVRRNQYGGDTYTFTTVAKWSLLAPMDLVTIRDMVQNLNTTPVRITSYTEQQDGSFEAEAEPFVYGMCAPTALTTTAPTQNPNNTQQSAGNVNTPIIFEPIPRLYANGTQAQLWIVVSSSNSLYGGCQVYISTDGGASFNPAGDPLVGSAITGVSTADWPASSDPDTTNDLPLDLTESNGILSSYQASDRDNFLYPCYIAGGGSYAIPYELLSYNTATLTALSKYTLKATGTSNKLRRGVFGAPASGIGVDHPIGSRFALLPPSGEGVLKLDMDPTWIGITLQFKICSFNNFGSAAQSLTDVSAFSYTPTGTGGAVSPAHFFLVNGS